MSSAAQGRADHQRRRECGHGRLPRAGGRDASSRGGRSKERRSFAILALCHHPAQRDGKEARLRNQHCGARAHKLRQNRRTGPCTW